MKHPLRRYVDDVVPLSSLTASDKSAKIVNVVSTIHFLDEDESFNVRAVAMKYNRFCKYEPDRFAAVVMRVNIGFYATGLIFDTGRFVIVGVKTFYQALYACQQFRKLIEDVAAPYRDPDTGRIEICTLQGKLKVRHFHVENMVAYVVLGGFPNLPKLLEDVPGIAMWNPELFPSLNLLLWLTPKSECTCEERKNSSCACNGRVLLFDTGRMVLTGFRNHRDMNFARLCMITILESDVYQEKGVIVPPNQRFYARRRKLLQSGFLEWNAPSEPEEKKRKAPTQSIKQMMTSIEKSVKKTKRQKIAMEPGTVFMNACEAGQVENVRMMLQINPSYADEKDTDGNTALMRMEADESRGGANRDLVVKILAGYGSL